MPLCLKNKIELYVHEFTSIKMCISQMSILKKMMRTGDGLGKSWLLKKSSNKIKTLFYTRKTLLLTHFVLFYLYYIIYYI